MYNPLDSDIIFQDMEEIYYNSVNIKEFDESSVFISGAYGMLASYICFFFAYLNEYKGIKISIYAQGRNKERMHSCFGAICDRDYFFEELGEISDVIKGVPNVDFIIHAGGLADPVFYSRKPVEVAKGNTVDLYFLLTVACKTNVRKFLFFSSGDVYGKIMNKNEITEKDMGISDPLSDHACYTESKRMGETFCRDFWREYRVPTVIARIGHTYGPTMNIKEDTRVFSSFMRDAVAGRNIEMKSDGLSRRPFCYITDAVSAYMLLLLKGEPGEAYNVCNTYEFLTIRELADIICGLENSKVDYIPRNENDGYINNEDNKDNKPVSIKLEELGWKCHVSTRQGFERVYKYQKEKSHL